MTDNHADTGSGRDKQTADLSSNPRRDFMRTVSLGVAGAALVGTATGVLPTAARAQSASLDIDILNFALNLEYLEAEYYLRGVFGHGLEDGDVDGNSQLGTLGGVSGGALVPFVNNNVRSYATEIALDELRHVRFLRGTLGASRIPRPTISLRDSFNTLAVAAGLGASFDPFASEDNFLIGAFVFEDVGVTAYKGAAPLVQDKGVLTAAAGLLAVEAAHAGSIRTVLYSKGKFAEATKISNLRKALSGANDDDGLGQSNYTILTPVDNNGLAYSRTTRQVLNIVYGAVNASSGLFFPNGLNGPIH